MNILAKQHKITVNEERTSLTDDDRQETEKDDFDRQWDSSWQVILSRNLITQRSPC